MENNIEREAFEKWYASMFLVKPSEGLKLINDRNMFRAWQAARAQAEPSSGVPEGYRLVPVESTVEMDRAGGDAISAPVYDAECCWRAMVAAAPTPEAVQGEPASLRQRLFSGWEGCSNHGCVVVDPKPGMMRTNGSCQCVVNASRSQLYMLQSRIQSLIATPQPAGAALPPEITREMLGMIIDEVFDGGIEDASVIEDIYRVIARSATPQPAEQQPSVGLVPGWCRSELREKINAVSGRSLDGSVVMSSEEWNGIVELVEKLLTAAPTALPVQGGAEPACWIDEDELEALQDGDSLAMVRLEEDSLDMIPLYTHPQPAQQGSVPEVFMRLFEHARGLSFGHDWNKGTAQSYHRKPLLEAVEECKRYLAAPRPEGDGWISVKERHPPIFDQCLGWNATANMINKANTYRLFTAAMENTCDISHWMPLPQPPKTKEDRGHE